MSSKHFVIVAGAALALGVLVSRLAGVGSDPAVNPYVITIVSSAWSGENLLYADTSVTAVRRDGSVATRNVRVGKEEDRLVRVVTGRVDDVSAGRIVNFDEFTKSKQTVPLSEEQRAVRRPPRQATSCGVPDERTVVDQSPAPAEILGYSVVKVTRTFSSGTGSPGFRKEMWLAPAVACAPLLEVGSISDAAGNWTKVVEKKAVSVSLGDPPSRMFQVPEGVYAERPPSEQFRRASEILGRKECSSCAQSASVEKDRVYHERRRLAGWE